MNTIRTIGTKPGRTMLLFPRTPVEGTCMKTILALPLLFLASSTQGQTGIRITDPAQMLAVPNLGNDAAKAGMQAAGLSNDVIANADRLSTPANWPKGLRTDSARAANKTALRNYNAFLLFEYPTDEGALTVVTVPATANYHMPEDLRSTEDFILVLRAGGTELVEPTATRTPASKGPSWKNMRPAKIIKPDDVFATYHLADDAEALAALEKEGMSKAEIEAVIFRSQERNWPDGIDSFNERYPRLEGFKKYKAYQAISWADKVLLVIPVEANKKAPTGLRPYLDIYMVFAATAVEVKSKK